MEKELYNRVIKREEDYWWFVSRRKIINKVIGKFLTKSDNKILEIGCGSGGNLEMLSKFGDVYASELDKTAFIKAKERNIAKAIEQNELPLEEPFKGKKFDAIMMFDVLEHIDDDEQVAKVVKEKLNSDGKLFITVPAMEYLWSKHDEDCHHKRRYNKKTITKVLKSAGFKIDYFSYFNFWLFPVVFMFRLKDRITKSEKTSEEREYSPRTNSILKFVFGSESFFLPTISFPLGVSLIIVARRNDYEQN